MNCESNIVRNFSGVFGIKGYRIFFRKRAAGNNTSATLNKHPSQSARGTRTGSLYFHITEDHCQHYESFG